jgi:hypothetical protein
MKRLTGETEGRPGDDTTRVPLNVHDETRERLRTLLHMPFMRGVGYSEFIDRAVARAWEEVGHDTVPQRRESR